MLFKKTKFSILTLGILLTVLVLGVGYAQDQQSGRGDLILRQAKQYKKANVAVEAYLKGHLLEVTVSARVYADRPKIDNVIVVGPKLGRLAPTAKTTLYASEEEQEPIAATESKGLFGFGSRSKARKIKGALTRERFKFKIPPEKIIKGKRYELRIKIDSQKLDGKFLKFKFPLKDLPRLISE